MQHCWRSSIVLTLLVLGCTGSLWGQGISVKPGQAVEDIVRGFAEAYASRLKGLSAEGADAKRCESMCLVYRRRMEERLKALGVPLPEHDRAADERFLPGHLVIGDQLVFWDTAQPITIGTHQVTAPAVLWGRTTGRYGVCYVEDRHRQVTGELIRFLEAEVVEEESLLPLTEGSRTIGSGLIVHRRKAWTGLAQRLCNEFKNYERKRRGPAPDRVLYPAWLSLESRFRKRASDEMFIEEVAASLIGMGSAHERAHAQDIYSLEPAILEAADEGSVAHHFIEVRAWLAGAKVANREQAGLWWWLILSESAGAVGIKKERADRVLTELAIGANIIRPEDDGRLIEPVKLERLYRELKKLPEWAGAALKRLDDREAALVQKLGQK